jgi:hypothetical protein
MSHAYTKPLIPTPWWKSLTTVYATLFNFRRPPVLFLATTLPAHDAAPIEALAFKFAGGSTLISFVLRLVAKDVAETIVFFRREVFRKGDKL